MLAALYINCTVGLTCLNTEKLVARFSGPFELNKYINELGHLLSSDGRYFNPVSQTIIQFCGLRFCSENYCWCLIVAGYDAVWISKICIILEAFTPSQFNIVDFRT